MPTPRLLRILLVALLTIPALLLASPAAACACGGISSNDPSANVNGETAILTKVGNLETIDMQLSMRSVAADAALVIPTPAPATVSKGDAARFTEFAAITAPRVETRKHWWSSSSTDSDGATSGAAPPGSSSTGAPTVTQQITLGPMEATVLTGGDLAGLRKWLSDNNYRLKPAVAEALAPYVSQRWSFVAIRLTSSKSLSGPLDPIRMTFRSGTLLYPMRMSAAAASAQFVTTYVVADHRQRRVDADASDQTVSVEYAGRLGSGGYLTKIFTSISNPGTITADFVFADAPSDEPFQQVTYRDSDVTILGIMAGPFLVGVGIVIVVILAAAVVAVRSRRT